MSKIGWAFLFAATGSTTFSYDYAGRRTEAYDGVLTTDYLWDEFSRFGDVVLESSASGDVSYTLAGGMVISQTQGSTTHYLLGDALNSTRALTDGSGVVTDTFDYDAFGNLLGNPTSLATNYLYTGQQYDDVTDLYSLRARYYDPNVGRLLSRDTWAYDYQNPIELNRYVYVANNPVNWIDPSGYFLVDYSKMNAYVGSTTNFVLHDFAWSIFEGAVAGAVGYIMGIFAYNLVTDITIDEWHQGRTINMERVFTNTFEMLRQNAHIIFFSALWGGFLGAANYAIGKAIKSHFWSKFAQGNMLTPYQYTLLTANLGAGFILTALPVAGLQSITNMWASDIRDPNRTVENMADIFKDVLVSGAFNAGSTIGALSNLSSSVSIAVTIGFNTFATLTQETN